jgi:mycofactocin precursor
MTVTPTTGAVMDHNPITDTAVTEEPQLGAEDLIEEVSIDGMCGVY